MTTTVIEVTGMTCEHCVSAVSSELSTLPGVTAVAIELQAGGITPVTISSESDLDPAAVAAAVDEAGYELTPRA